VLRAPDALLWVERRVHNRLLVLISRVAVDSRCSLGSKISVFLVEFLRAYAVVAPSASEPHAPSYALDGVVFHAFSVVASRSDRQHDSEVAKVIRCRMAEKSPDGPTVGIRDGPGRKP
jgi:hypothetical protein